MSLSQRVKDGALRSYRARRTGTSPAAAPERISKRDGTLEVSPLEIAPNDPLLRYCLAAGGTVDVDSLEVESTAKDALRQAGVKLVVPLISQGELIGLVNLGPRRSEQEYSADDRKLLANLAAQAAPALRVGQLVRRQEVEVRARERMEQELRLAQLIQQQFLPKEPPELAGWHVSTFYRPAREVGGDFYDLIELPDGRIGIVVGDVTDKGVPAALVMASARSIMRGAATRPLAPGAALARANELLVPDTPERMFVTCFYGVLDPDTGHFQYANAGHNVPYVRTEKGLVELRATGLPLGLFPETTYEEKQAIVADGDIVLFHSDGLVEAHNEEGQMFGFPRLKSLMEAASNDEEVIELLLTELDGFTGQGIEQEDDITLVTVVRSPVVHQTAGEPPVSQSEGGKAFRVLTEFTISSEPGNERLGMQRVAEAIEGLGLLSGRLENLKTAVAETLMNAIEHGNNYRAELLVSVRVLASDTDLFVVITDQGGGAPIPEPERPDIEAKLAGLQKPRGWGLYLIKNMVDEMHTTSDERHHTVELIVHLTNDATAASPSAERTARPSPEQPVDGARGYLSAQGPLQRVSESRTMGSRTKELPMDEQELKVSVRKLTDSASVLDIEGNVTSKGESVLMDAYNRASTEKTRAILLNFGGLEYMNSSGIGLLVTLLVRANRQQQRILAYGLDDHYREIFELTRLDDAIGIHDGEEDALAAVDDS